MMKVIILIIFFAVMQCELRNGYKFNYTKRKQAKLKDELEYWKPEVNFEEKFSTSERKRKMTKTNNIISEHSNEINGTNKHQGTTKWPKILRQFTIKTTPRITKMHMMQEGEDNTVSVKPLEPLQEHLNQYLSSYSIKQQLEKLSKQIPHSNVTVEVVGRSVEYQDIVLLKITEDKLESEKYFRADDDKYADDAPEKKIIFIVHGLSVMGIKDLPCLTWEKELLTLMSYYANHLDKFDIFLIPMANPDGYALLQPAYGAVWNKNAAPQPECSGVALDRNFDVAWSSNRSISSCSQEYPGIVPFSEAETRVVRDIFHKYSHKIVAFINVHAGTYDSVTFKGDAVLYPKGYTDSVTDDDKYIDLKGEIDEAIRNASFQVFSVAVETLYNWYGKVTGSSVDYASTVYGIPFALELVMQLYNNDNVPELSETYTESALTEVWSRVIDVIFKYIWRVLNKGNEVR